MRTAQAVRVRPFVKAIAPWTLVLTCSTRALDFGPLSALMMEYGDRRDLEDMPSSRITKPAVVFKCHAEKKQLVSYNAEKALQLLMRRDPLPPVFTSVADVVEIPEGTIFSSRLVIKHESAADIMRYTRSHEG